MSLAHAASQNGGINLGGVNPGDTVNYKDVAREIMFGLWLAKKYPNCVSIVHDSFTIAWDADVKGLYAQFIIEEWGG